jgi:membrane-associated protein
MEWLWSLFHAVYDVEGLVRVGGLMALIAIVFAETGLLIGFFLPGDSLLVTAGLFTVSGHLDSLLFHKKHLITTQAFYDRHGGITIVLARFMPILRTFAPLVAGVGNMQYGRFALYNVMGGVGWVVSMTSIGYFLGKTIPDIDRYIHIVIAAVILLSLLPGIIAFLRSRQRARTLSL